jgi:circadian clock protein KaiC
MNEAARSDDAPGLDRVSTGVAGLDAILGGGIPARRTCLVAGVPGTGKTTLGNQLAFAHAVRGGTVIVATLLAESHDILIENLRSFRFFDSALVGSRIRYLSLQSPLEEGGLDATVDLLRHEVRESRATVLIVDGTAVVEDFARSAFDLRRFAQRLEVQFSLLGCTTILLTGHVGEHLRLLGGHVNGVILLANDLVGPRHVRTLEVVKMRGVRHAGGMHEFSITADGLTVFPRLESIVGHTRLTQSAEHGLGTGVPELDTMLGGGILPHSSTAVMGTPGAGKTILGLSFLYEGATQGERGLFVGFHETAEELADTAAGIGKDLRRVIDTGVVRVLWTPPLERSADAWAWQVLATVEEHAPVRIFIDAMTDVQRVMASPNRMSTFLAALVNELRARGATTVISNEIDAYTDDSLTVPIPAASATMDNGILLRHVEIHGHLRRLVTVLKVRQAASDPAIREMAITRDGIVVSRPFRAMSGLLVGRGAPDPSDDGETAP